MDRQRDNLGVGGLFFDLVGGLDAVEIRHAYIHDDDVRVVFAN